MQLTKENTRIAKNKSGNFEIRWTENNAIGKPATRTYSCRTNDRNKAEATREAWLAAQDLIVTHSSEKTVDELIREYTEHYIEARNKSSAQRWSLLQISRKLGSDTLLTLNVGRITSYAKDRRRDGVVDSTIRRELGALVAVLNWCRKKEVLPRDTILPDIELPQGGEGRDVYMDDGEERRMWDLAVSMVYRPGFRDHRLGLFICLALETAARSQAIETLEWKRVNLVRGMIDYRDVTLQISNKRRVPVPISNRLMPVLEYSKTRALTGYVLGVVRSTYKPFCTFCETNGFDVTRHDMRRTWATLAAQAGVPLWDIAGVLGGLWGNYKNPHY